MSERPSTGVITSIMIIMIIVSSNLNWSHRAESSIQESDSNGYYAYLPAVFIYHDLHFAFFDDIEGNKYRKPNYASDYRFKAEGGKLNKFLCGTALAQLPFFAATHSYCLISNAEADGYSRPYSIMVTISALFYLVMGLWFFDQLLKRFKIGCASRCVTLILVSFGTQLFNYAVVEPGMSHVYSFGLVSLFTYAVHCSLQSQQKKWLFVASAALAMVVLIRPINGLIIFAIPFLAGSWQVLRAWMIWLFKNPSQTIVSVLFFLSIVSIQALYFQLASGHWWVDTYPGETFNFSDPHFIDILFSYKKGLFVYTPAFLIAVSVAVWQWRKDRFKLLSFALFFFLITYFMSSWWNWWYGGSFSSRVYTEYIPVLFMPLAALIADLKTKPRNVLFVLIALIIVLCQVQTYQYRYYIIHWENMDENQYWKQFLLLKK